LAACYAAAYAPLLQVIAKDGAAPPLPDLVDELLSDRQFRREGLNIWLALWAEIGVNDTLRSEHMRQYDRYHAAIARSIAAHAGGRAVEAAMLASALIALLDGLWVEMCIAPDRMDLARARVAVKALLEPHLGVISTTDL